jgi:hypothetical protein
MLLVSVSPREHNLGITSLVTPNIDALLSGLKVCTTPSTSLGATHGRLWALKPVYDTSCRDLYGAVR